MSSAVTPHPIVDDALEHGVELPERVLALLPKALNVEESEGGHEVADVGGADEPQRFADGVEERRSARFRDRRQLVEALAERHPGDDVARAELQLGVYVLGIGGAVAPHRTHEADDLIPSDRLEVLQPPRVEDFGHVQLLHLG